MGSVSWPYRIEGEGILSTNQDINPLGWGSNLVYIPYCTSDLWIGDSSKEENEFQSDFHFRGARVIRRVIESLIEDGMRPATHVLVTGTSAGGVGVMFHIDNIAEQLHRAGSKAEVRGISDSGWFIETGNVADKGSIQYWQVNSTVSAECLERNIDDQWKCLYGNNIYPRIKAPLMIVQFYYDAFQMFLNGIDVNLTSPNPIDHESFETLRHMMDQVTSSLRDIDTVFGVSCFGHGILDNTQLFSELKVKGVTLRKAIECWYMGICSRRNMDICEVWEPLLQCNESCPNWWYRSIYQDSRYDSSIPSPTWSYFTPYQFYTTPKT